ncbi:MAG TPA: HIT family protein [Candidatus Polarisedimenticolaceae bacterium]|nr:HIT family protein [Candidatus Polarisedimenticolaceae bacterium]
MSCLFCRIASGQEPALKVLEDARFVAFLDHRPLFPGHVLLIPREHVATLLDLPDTLLEPLMRWTRELTRAVEEAMGAEGAFVAVNHKVSQSVPHMHVHVVPRRRGDGLKGFFWPRHPYRDAAHAEETRAFIAARLG